MQNLGIYGNSGKIAEKIQERLGAGIWTTNRRGREREGTGRELGGNSEGTRRELGGNSRGGGGNWAGTHGRWRELGGNSAGNWRELGRNLAGTFFFAGPLSDFPGISGNSQISWISLNKTRYVFIFSGRPKVSGRLHEIVHFIQRLLKFGTMSVFAVGTKGSLVFTRTNIALGFDKNCEWVTEV